MQITVALSELIDLSETRRVLEEYSFSSLVRATEVLDAELIKKVRAYVDTVKP